ncbi:MAG: DciA family protein [Gammaproteobacteria bacterium]
MPSQSSHIPREAPKTFDKSLRPYRWFQQLQVGCQAYLRLQSAFQKAAPLEYRQHCYPVKYENSHLYLESQQPEWVLRLRFDEKVLVKALGIYSEFRGITRVICTVNPLMVKSQPAIRKPNPISASSARLIQEMAGDVKDEALKKALLKLGRQA